MIDIKLIRENKELVEKALSKRMDSISLDELLEWDKKKRDYGKDLDDLREMKNNDSDKIAKLKQEGKDASGWIEEMKNTGAKISEFTVKYNTLDLKIKEFLMGLPNMPDEDVVAGGKENNEVIRTHLEKTEFNFEPKNHIELAKSLNLIDYERGIKLAGQGSWIYTGMGARLEWALLNYFIDSHIKDGWTFMLVPHMLNYECGYTAGQFPKFQDEVYWLDGKCREEGKFMLPTAETALVNIHRDEILNASELPKKYFSYTPCYRREAGSSRVEERGTVRGHQFNKIELVQYTENGKTENAFDEMLEKAENLMQKLGLHYQVSKMAAGDCAASMCKTCDVEVWIPSMNAYKEVSSASNSREYQARRGNMKYKEENIGKAKFMNTLNASGLATSRLVPAILEQYQNEDGSITIPEVLRPYMGGLEKITKED